AVASSKRSPMFRRAMRPAREIGHDDFVRTFASGDALRAAVELWAALLIPTRRMADSRGFANQRENDSRWQTGAFAMGQPIAVRTDYTAAEVRLLAKQAKDAAQARRLLAIAAVLDGSSRTEAATNTGMDR